MEERVELCISINDGEELEGVLYLERQEDKERGEMWRGMSKGLGGKGEMRREG